MPPPGAAGAAPGDPPPARAHRLSHTLPELPVREATVEELARVHSAEYLAEVAELEVGRGRDARPRHLGCARLDPGGPAGRGAAVEAVSYVLEEPERRALCLVRPPGHHARPASGMGFCIYANVAVAAADALARFELNRVLIVDFDVHHGNGTQEIFYESSRVGFLSIHRYPFYPGTGARDETGTGHGPGLDR